MDAVKKLVRQHWNARAANFDEEASHGSRADRSGPEAAAEFARARGREPFSSREKFGETALAHFNGQLSRVLRIARNLRSEGYFAEPAGESA